MSVIEDINSTIRRALCAPLEVAVVPAGFAINTGFPLPDGDLLSFYLIAHEDGGYHLEDDGTTLPNAIASGLDLKSSVRENLLRGLLFEERARLDDDMTIRSETFAPAAMGAATMRFISALIRTRDLTLLSRENVAASFADDVRSKISARLPETLVLEVDRRPSEVVGPDIVLRSRATGLKAARIYAAGADLRLMDALVDFQAAGPGDSPVIAVVDRRRGRVSEKRFNGATNRGLPMAVIDGDGDEWLGRILAISNPRLDQRVN